MEIRHLISFLKIIETGSYTAAASELGYTQSTITSHMQLLEQEVGGALFFYANRTLQLSPLGQEIIPLAEDLLATHEKIKSIQQQDSFEGVLKIAAPESLTISRLGSVLQKFMTAYPNVNIVLSNGTCKENQDELLHGRVDVALMLYPMFSADRCTHDVLTEEKIVIIGHPTMPDHFDAIRSSADTYVYLTNEDGCSYRTMFEACVRNQDISFQTQELWSIGAIKKMVMNGLGFAVLPYVTVADEVEAGAMKIIQHDETFEPMYAHLLAKQSKWGSPVTRAFQEIVLDQFTKSK
ncbi:MULTISPECIES: LysR family transcriptional regulator [Exiguobacterium]|uniref:LysR family transcriptional regulator n=1 Tax=Exiguobacterium TaxID=33986 RepID=UPI00064719E9|nr:MULTISPECIES: LysR family transcriptional regulator [unclassified Exiguobacterium]